MAYWADSQTQIQLLLVRCLSLLALSFLRGVISAHREFQVCSVTFLQNTLVHVSPMIPCVLKVVVSKFSTSGGGGVPFALPCHNHALLAGLVVSGQRLKSLDQTRSTNKLEFSLITAFYISDVNVRANQTCSVALGSKHPRQEKGAHACQFCRASCCHVF